MFFKLFLIFTIFPLIELGILIQLGKVIGVLPTIIITVMISLIGVSIAKSQGLSVIKKLRYEFSQGRMPGNEIINGVCILIGGVLLITPGLISDTLGLLLLFPLSREMIKGTVKRYIEKKYFLE